MDMSAEAIQEIGSLVERARNAEAHKFQNIKEHPDFITVSCPATGQVSYLRNKVSPLSAEVTTLRAFVQCENELELDAENAVIWLNDESVTLVFNEHRSSKAKMILRQNPILRMLTREGFCHLSPAVMRQKIKIDLFAAQLEPWDISEIIGSLKFEVNQVTENVAKKGDESISKSVRGRVTGTSEIPETVTLSFEAYPELMSEVSTIISVVCAIVTDTSNGVVSIMPMPGQIEIGIKYALDCIAAKLADLCTSPVILGRLF